MSKEEKRALCAGCRNDFYNGQNPMGIKECWSLESAVIKDRYRIGWAVPMDRPENVRPFRTLSCWHAPGQFAVMDEMPIHLRYPR